MKSLNEAIGIDSALSRHDRMLHATNATLGMIVSGEGLFGIVRDHMDNRPGLVFTFGMLATWHSLIQLRGGHHREASAGEPGTQKLTVVVRGGQLVDISESETGNGLIEQPSDAHEQPPSARDEGEMGAIVNHNDDAEPLAG